MAMEASVYNNSAAAVGMWNQTADVVVDRKAEREYDFMKHIIRQEEIKTKEKVDMMVKLSGQKKTLLKGGAFMINNKRHHFEEFEKALKALKLCETKPPETLAKVEELLQEQATAILNMKSNVLTEEEKSMCLFTVHNEIINLGKVPLAKCENTYVPNLIREKNKVMAMADEKGLDPDKIKNYIYDKSHRVPSDPTLKDWEFLDLRKIDELDYTLSLLDSSKELDPFRREDDLNIATPSNRKEDIVTYVPVVDGVQNIDKQKIGRALSEVSQIFTPEAIKADPERFFLHMQQSLSEFNLGRDVVFNTAKNLAKMIGKNNAKVQEAIYKENNEMGRTM